QLVPLLEAEVPRRVERVDDVHEAEVVALAPDHLLASETGAGRQQPAEHLARRAPIVRNVGAGEIDVGLAHAVLVCQRVARRRARARVDAASRAHLPGRADAVGIKRRLAGATIDDLRADWPTDDRAA